MRLRQRQIETRDEFDIWPAFADLMSNAFMIMSFLLLLAIIKPLVSISSLRANEQRLSREVEELQQYLSIAERRSAAAEERLAVLEEKNRTLALKNKALANQNEDLEADLRQEQQTPKAPPIIVIRDTGAYRFASGSAQLPSALEKYVRDQLVPKIEQNAKQYDIDVVEVIGHTDGQPNGGSSNLDGALERVAKGDASVSALNPGSNADLGLMRALAVVNVLQRVQQEQNKLEGLEFRPYSAAQLVSPDGGFASANRNPDAQRRRIEIRFTRLGRTTEVES